MSGQGASRRPGWRAWWVWLALGMGQLLPALAQEPGIPDGETGSIGVSEDLPSTEILLAEGARVGEIRVFVGDIFDLTDPDEDKRIFRLVDRLHRATRDWVVLQDLLFEPGDLFDPRLLAESERLLRTNRYFYDAEIRPVGYRDGVVDLEVHTRDVWTLSGGVNFARTGGENSTDFEIQDFNFLGTGKEIGITRSSDVDRTASTLLYQDGNLSGTRATLQVKVSENSDGHRRVLRIERPFYALDTRWSAGLTIIDDLRLERIFDEGRVIDSFRNQANHGELSWGFSKGLVDGRAVRWRLGYSYLGNRLARDSGPSELPELPPDRVLSFPWVEMELVQDRFIEVIDLDRIARTEDLNLGTRFAARLGLSSTSLGATFDRGFFFLRGSRGFRPSGDQLVLTDLEAIGRWTAGEAEATTVKTRGRFFWRDFGDHLFFASLELGYARKLDPEQQLLLGGDTGLRGYPLRFQTGDRRFLLTLEQRFYTRWEPFQLVNVGAAVFFDVGRAWFAGRDGIGDQGVLKDVGFGLRLSPSRSGRGTVVHVDVAFPLDRTPSIDSVQWLVTTKETF